MMSQKHPESGKIGFAKKNQWLEEYQWKSKTPNPSPLQGGKEYKCHKQKRELTAVASGGLQGWGLLVFIQSRKELFVTTHIYTLRKNEIYIGRSPQTEPAVGDDWMTTSQKHYLAACAQMLPANTL